MRECSRNRPTIERIRIPSVSPGTAGASRQRPRTTRSTGTPVCDARDRSAHISGSSSWFILQTIRAGRPAWWFPISRSIRSTNSERIDIGATASVENAFGSFLSVVCEAEVAPDGDIRLRRIVAALDCGQAVNPDSVRAQIEGGLVFGMTATLYGVRYPQTALECSEREWDEQIDVNLKGTFLMSKCALPAMIAQKSGIIVNNSSGWGIVGGDHAVAYCASKGGVVLMTKAMAIDHGAQGIRVNCICPGDVETPMLPQDAKMRGLKWEDYLAGCANRPLARIGTVEEIAKAVLFLASDDASFMTGAALVVDGGGTAD